MSGFDSSFSTDFGAEVSTVPDYNDCVWPVDPACLTTEWEAFAPEVQQRALALAGSTLRRLTGYRVGGCPVTVRPCKSGCRGGFLPSFYTMMHGGQWAGFSPHINLLGYWVNSCGCRTDCSCTTLCELALPPPVGEVYEVKVDGAVVIADNYRIDGASLVWTGEGECPWPVCQDLSKPDTEPGTFSVRYLNSYPVDGLGAYAAGVLAVEFGRACNGDQCRLPVNITSLARQGVVMELEPGTFPNGITNIHEVDAFISLWNPGGLSRPARVWTPSVRPPRVMG